MNKKPIETLADRINKIYESEDVYAARETIKKELQFWQNETSQMMEDKENRMLFAAGVAASFLLGVMLCILF